ncbi:S8 family serine peptidase [Kineosporia sp. J2-2]|uniref:S8 family serine peptidase n=1 Tax=Kineosporia corallincola TaxID=2835133 RepID=A0ABS5TNH6_9ACTN|nr:S8 family serine peptidase [Kineosporia corallincola]MBT0772651.1 S8 family serine peptidase [Kineosporia corallincola]
MTDPRPARRALPRRKVLIRIAVGLSAATAAAVALSPVVASALPASLGGDVSRSAPAPLVGSGSSGAIDGQYVVMLKDQAGLSAAGVDGADGSSQSLVAEAVERGEKAGATVHTRYTEALRGYSATLSDSELDEIRDDPAVDYVAVNQRYTSTGTQDDAEWGLDRIDQHSATLNGSYYYTNTGKGVTAYVVDTGIRSTHQDFGGRVSGGTSTLNGDSSTEDCEGHGTHVAGTIGGTTYGVAKEATLVPIRVLDCEGGSTSSIVAEGLDWIVSHHKSGKPAVANLSLTNEGGADPVVEAAVERVIADGVTVVIAAGNGNAAGEGIPACTVSPSDVKAAIVVGATTRTDRKTGFSNYGACVDLYAPGLGITSDWADSDSSRATLSGTSMATPHVTGAVALYLQNHPTATPKQVQAAVVGAATSDAVTKVSTKWPRKLLFAVQKAKAPAATTAKSSITSGKALLNGKSITSANGLYTLTQSGTDLTLSKPGSRVLWRTGKGAAWTTLTNTGNLVSYNAYGKKVWSSGSSGGAASLKLTNQGQLKITTISTGKTAWTGGKAQKTAPAQNAKGLSTLNQGSALYRGGRTLVSKNGTYSLAFQANGNLTLTRKGSGVVWSTGKKNADWLTVKSDGNLALVNSDGTTAWTSKTAGQGGNRLRLLSDGKLQLVKTSGTKIVWTAK